MFPCVSSSSPEELPILSPDLVERARIADLAIEQTKSYRDVEALSILHEPKAHFLHDRHEAEVRPAWRAVVLIAQQQARLLVNANTVATHKNAEIDAEIDAEQERCEQEAAPFKERLKPLVAEQLPFAHMVAGDLAAKAGRPYNPQDPSDSHLLSGETPDLRVIALKEKLPYPPDDVLMKILYKAKPAILLAEVVAGLITGLGMVAYTKQLQGRNLTQLSLPMLAYLVAGIVFVLIASWVIRWLCGQSALQYYRRVGWKHLIHWLLLLVLSVTLFCRIDGWFQSHGVRDIVSAGKRAGSVASRKTAESNDNDWWIGMGMAAFVSLLAMSQGYSEGRESAVMSNLLARQEQERKRLEAYRRAMPAVQEALRSFALVRAIKHQIGQEQDAIARIEQIAQEKYAHLESQRLPIRDVDDNSLNEPIKRAYVHAIDVQNQWYADLASLMPCEVNNPI